MNTVRVQAWTSLQSAATLLGAVQGTLNVKSTCQGADRVLTTANVSRVSTFRNYRSALHLPVGSENILLQSQCLDSPCRHQTSASHQPDIAMYTPHGLFTHTLRKPHSRPRCAALGRCIAIPGTT